MPLPTLTPEELAQLTKEKAKAESAAATFQSAVAGQEARAQELAVVDGVFKKFFDYYNDDIIGKYDEELRWINGRVVTDPIVESDIVAVAELTGGRLQPSLPQTDLIRIDQFDGNPFTTDTNNEFQKILDQTELQDAIQFGYVTSPIAGTVETNSILDSNSTTLQLTDTSTYSISPGDIYIISDGVSFAVVRFDTFVMQVSPVPPPYVADCDITILVPPSSAISVGATLNSFTGFNNSERSSKTASDPNLQGLMDYLIQEIETQISGRITCMDMQLQAIDDNQDPEGTSEFSAAISNINDSRGFLTSFIGTMDVSDSGLLSLSNDMTTRFSFATTRVSEINSAYTDRTQNYYDERYNAANNRGSTSRGSLRLQKAQEQVAGQSQAFADGLTAQANALGSVLP